MSDLITLAEIEAARARIAPFVAPTPIVTMTPTGLRLKAESLTPIGAFKIRGAFNALLSLPEEARAAGVVAHSSGNHAQAVAFAAARLGLAATIVMPNNAPAPKVEGVRRSGAQIVTVGPASAERAARAKELAAERGAALIEPLDMAEIMAGTGTIGLEILKQAPDVEIVFAPVSGGGLLGGLAAAIKLSRPAVRVIGVEPELANDAAQSFRAGEVIAIPAEQASSTLADGLRVQKLGARTWPHIRAFVDDIVTVSEDAMRAAMRRIAAEARLIAEPSGAVAAAGALAHGSDVKRSVAVLSGGNVDPALYASILAEA
ncbi:MAG: threonine ammonia-lyase [Caulobacteraceae bacterium]